MILTIKNQNFNFRKIEKKDFNSNYLELLSQLTVLDKHKITKQEFNNMIEKLNSEHVILVLEDIENDKIVSTITYFKEHKFIHNMGIVAHIEDVVVDSSYRGLGIGNTMIQYVKSVCQDCYKIILDCSDENIGFYNKCGFKIKDNHMSFYL